MTTYKDFILPENFQELKQIVENCNFKNTSFGIVSTPFLCYKDSNHMSVPLSTNISMEKLENDNKEDILDRYINEVKVFIDEYYKYKEEEDK